MKQDIPVSKLDGRLVSFFFPNHSPEMVSFLQMLIAQPFCNQSRCLLIDAGTGEVIKALGISPDASLSDVLFNDLSLNDIIYPVQVVPNQYLSVIDASDIGLADIIGTLAALSMSYDWVYVVTPNGCTPHHIRLAEASDSSAVFYDTDGDNFMRAYWMLDAVRRRSPRFDPIFISHGKRDIENETSELLTATAKEFLGGSPYYAGFINDPSTVDALITSIIDTTDVSLVA